MNDQQLNEGSGQHQRAQQLFRLGQMKKNWSDYLNDSTNELWLCLLRLDRAAIKFLMEKWAVLRQSRRQALLFGNSTPANEEEEDEEVKRLEKLQLYECRFADEQSVLCLIQFMVMVGTELKEFGLSDSFLADEDDFVLDENSIVAILRGLSQVPSLERLVISHVFLRGNAIGQALQHTLTSKSCHIREVKLWNCKIDQTMFQHFLVGLQRHASGLHSLSLAECGMEDRKFAMLVQTLDSSTSTTPTQHSLLHLQLSKSRITEQSLPGLTRLLASCSKLRNLCLSECRQLCHGVTAPNDARYLAFVRAIAASRSLREISLCSCGITNDLAKPLFCALENDGGGNSKLQHLDVRGIDPLTQAAAGSVARWHGLQNLCAHLNLENQALRSALRRNTSLLELNCMLEQQQRDDNDDDEVWCPCLDKEICHWLRRNRFLQKVPRFLSHHGERLNATTWPLCVQQLQQPAPQSEFLSKARLLPFLMHSSPSLLRQEDSAVGDMSAVLAFVTATSLDMAQMYRCNGSKNRI